MKVELEKLLLELKSAYKISDIKNNKYCFENNRKWGYSLIESSLEVNQPLIIGFNWGVNKKWDDYKQGKAYKNQEEIEKRDVNLREYKGFVQKVLKTGKRHFPKIKFEKASHSNFCFFRSETENQISEKDINLCLPIFLEMIEIVKPNVIFCFSSKAKDFLLNKGFIHNPKTKTIQSTREKGNSYKVVVGLTKAGIPIFCLPHSSSRLKNEVRENAWKFAVENNPI